MPTFIARRGDGSFLSVGRRGGFKWVSSKSAATRFPVGPTAGRREVREVEDKLVSEGVEFSYEEVKTSERTESVCEDVRQASGEASRMGRYDSGQEKV